MANPFVPSDVFNIYKNKSNLNWIVLFISVVISGGSIYYTNVLVKQLKQRERRQIELFAKALEYTINESSKRDVYFITEEILFQNNSIPTILVDRQGKIGDYRNIEIDSSWSASKVSFTLNKELKKMKDEYDPIDVNFKDPETDEIYDTQYIYYRNSFLLTQLTYYPYIQLSVIAIFAFIAYLAFNYSKVAEQNRVWVGMAKETAHQLGTPISSLIAWLEFFKTDKHFKNSKIITELDKDIKKLMLITERFSSIGSVPILNEENIVDVVNNSVTYLQSRVSSKVNLKVHAMYDQISANINVPLFEWVIENIFKNAVDAMGGEGNLNIKIVEGSDWRVFVDISDDGKGIPKSKLKQVFNPGFTTKKRGWGLGLTLAKRIIENYHNGKVFVKSSEPDKGTTFRIVLRRKKPEPTA
ncbi:MAG: HAMP domain-containing histidine kinase [Bacteroidetes bacterium]|nr:HAMP domain-containing histidine kinase [Bacteroidota bacterium]